MPSRLRPTAAIAADAILVGDPGRALLLAQELLEKPKMSNHARGLWGYSGQTPAGRDLTVQSTGMGGPSARVVISDLAELGVRRAVRVGSCVATGEGIPLGDLVIVEKAHRRLGPGALEARSRLPDPELTARLRSELGDSARSGSVVSLDAPHRPGVEERPSVGAVADMQTATLLAAGEELEIAVAAVLIVSEAAGESHLGEEALERAAKVAGAAAATIL